MRPGCSAAVAVGSLRWAAAVARSPRRWSAGSGSRSDRLPLPTTTISPARVEILQREAGGLAGAQPQPNQDRQDREIPTASRRGAVAAGQQARHLLGLQRARQPRQPPRRNRRHRPDQRPGDHPLDMQEPQQRPQRRHHQLRRPAHLARAARDDERRDLRSTQLREIALALRADTGKKRPDGMHVVHGCPSHQAALHGQIVAVALQQRLGRRSGRWHRVSRHLADRTQIAQRRDHRPDRQVVGVASRTPRSVRKRRTVSGARSSAHRPSDSSQRLTCASSRTCCPAEFGV